MIEVGTFTEDQQRRYDRAWDFFHAHCYWIAAEPLEGSEELFLAELAKGMTRVEQVLAFNAKRYRLRGLSKRALEYLHIDLKAPCTLVESSHEAGLGTGRWRNSK